MLEDWEIHLNENWRTGGLDVYIFARSGGKTIFMKDIANGISETIGDGQVSPEIPTMALPIGVSEKLFESLSKRGIKTTDAGVTEGKLVATEKHLEDMRRLVFSKK